VAHGVYVVAAADVSARRAVRNWSQVLVPTVCPLDGSSAPLRTALLPDSGTWITHRWR